MLPREESRCVFLNKVGECSIYDARPVDCRLMRVVSEPQNCSKEAFKKGGMDDLFTPADKTENINRPISMISEILVSSALDLDGKSFESLPASILAHLESAPKTDSEEEDQMKAAAAEFEKSTRFDPTKFNQSE